MMYGSWVMEHDTEFVNLGHFLPFYFPNSPKNQNFEKMKKKNLGKWSFYTCAPKIMITWYLVPEIWCAMDEQMDRSTDGQTERKSDIQR